MSSDPLTIAWWSAQAASLAAIGAALYGVIPVLALLIPIVFYSLNIIDHPRTQNWLSKRRDRKITKLQAKLAVLTAKTGAKIKVLSET